MINEPGQFIQEEIQVASTHVKMLGCIINKCTLEQSCDCADQTSNERGEVVIHLFYVKSKMAQLTAGQLAVL